MFAKQVLSNLSHIPSPGIKHLAHGTLENIQDPNYTTQYNENRRLRAKLSGRALI
jgi:hypothetical protein